MNGQPLAGVRVVDLGRRPSTAWCSRLLADFGADVVMVEPPDGHPLRSHPPFGPDGRSTTARYFLANKRSVRTEAGASLLAQADVIVTDRDAKQLLSRNPGAVVCAITFGGLDGAYAGHEGNDLTAHAGSGWASVNGLRGREPLKGSGYQAAYQAGTLAYGAVVAALVAAPASAAGQMIDVSELEVLVSTFAPAPLRVQYTGAKLPRRHGITMNDGPVPVRDGFFALTLSRPLFWRKAMGVLGLADLAEDRDLQQPGVRQKHRARYTARVQQAMAKWTRADLFAALAAERVVAGPAFRIDEMGDNPQLLARDFFRAMPGSGARYPGPFARMPASAWKLKHEMPDAAAPNASFKTGDRCATKPVRAGSEGKGPLAGFRGLVLTQAWAGTYATQLLAFLGADVIQLETRGRLDSWRGTYQTPIPAALADVPTASHAWNCNPLYNSVNLNKRCITVDLANPDGVAIFKGLLPKVDFVAENFSPRVMGKLGLDYDTLRAIKPDLVMASLSAYGGIGPWRNVPGIGGTIEPSSGMSALLGYEGEQPQNSGQMYPDPVAGICAFAAIATALLHRDRTGAGQFIDLSMQEANFTFIGDAWLEYQTTGNVRGAQGNRHPKHAPHGMYPCAGDDQWIAIAAESDAQFQTIAAVLGLPTTGFDTALERKAREAELDTAIAAKTRARGKTPLAADLAERGVPAAAVVDAAEVADDANLRARGHMVLVRHPEAGPAWQSGCPVKFSGTPVAVDRHAPLQGEHSFEVFRDLLGMSRRRYEELVANGVTGKGPLPASQPKPTSLRSFD